MLISLQEGREGFKSPSHFDGFCPLFVLVCSWHSVNYCRMNQLANERQASSRKTDTLMLRIYVLLAIEVSDEAAGLRRGDGEYDTPLRTSAY